MTKTTRSIYLHCNKSVSEKESAVEYNFHSAFCPLAFPITLSRGVMQFKIDLNMVKLMREVTTFT